MQRVPSLEERSGVGVRVASLRGVHLRLLVIAEHGKESPLADFVNTSTFAVARPTVAATPAATEDPEDHVDAHVDEEEDDQRRSED